MIDIETMRSGTYKREAPLPVITPEALKDQMRKHVTTVQHDGVVDASSAKTLFEIWAGKKYTTIKDKNNNLPIGRILSQQAQAIAFEVMRENGIDETKGEIQPIPDYLKSWVSLYKNADAEICDFPAVVNPNLIFRRTRYYHTDTESQDTMWFKWEVFDVSPAPKNLAERVLNRVASLNTSRR